MTDLLDQSDIDALLAAVESGGVATATEPTMSAPTDPREAPEVHVYDFKRPERVSKEQMRAQ